MWVCLEKYDIFLFLSFMKLTWKFIILAHQNMQISVYFRHFLYRKWKKVSYTWRNMHTFLYILTIEFCTKTGAYRPLRQASPWWVIVITPKYVIFKLHVLTSLNVHVHTPCLHFVFTLHVHTSCSHVMFTLHVHASWSHFMFTLFTTLRFLSLFTIFGIFTTF